MSTTGIVSLYSRHTVHVASLDFRSIFFLLTERLAKNRPIVLIVCGSSDLPLSDSVLTVLNCPNFARSYM